MNRLNALLFGAALTLSATAQAHHGWSGYDAGQTLTRSARTGCDGDGVSHPNSETADELRAERIIAGGNTVELR